MKIQILIDHPSRDLIPASYVKLYLADRFDYKVTFDHQDFLNKVTYYDFFERTRDYVDVIVTPSYNVKRTPEIIARAVRQGSRIVVNHSEQLFPSHYYKEKFNTDHISAYNRHISSHIVWGEEFAKLLIKYADVDPSRILIAGNPKLDIARRSNSSKESASNNEDFDNTVLVVSDFLLADLTNDDWEKFKKDYSVKINQPVHYHYSKVRARCVEWVATAASRFPQIMFLMRPHPGEDMAPYGDLTEIPNIKITGGQAFYYDVLRSDVVFQYTSTSIFESLVAGKPVYSLQLVQQPPPYQSAPDELLRWVNKEEFSRILRRLSDGKTVVPDETRLNKLEKYMWKPMGNTLPRTAIAHAEAARIAVSDGAFNAIDKAAGIKFAAKAAMLSGQIRGGAVLSKMGISDTIYKQSRENWLYKLSRKDFINKRMVDKSIDEASELICESDVFTPYSLRQTTNGIYIDL